MTEPQESLLVFLALREGCVERAADVLRAERTRWSTHGEASAFLRIPDDPFAAFNPQMRGFEATLELRAGDHAASEALGGFEERWAPHAHLDLSVLVRGAEHTFAAGDTGAVRYHYLMRRRHDFDAARYLAHYRTNHSAIGMRTSGQQGYSQVHVDAETSAASAVAAGVGGWRVDSVSRLWIRSVEDFLTNAGPAGAEAIEDEKGFVDGANSVMFASAPLA